MSNPTVGYNIRGGAVADAAKFPWLCIPDPLPVVGGNYGPFTVEHWLYVNALPSNGGLLATTSLSGAWNSAGLNLYLRSEAGAGFAFTVSGAFIRAGTVPIGTWVHVAWTYDGSTGRLFLDGAEIGSAAFASIPQTLDYWHGSYNGGSGQHPADALVARLRFWGRALSGAELLTVKDQAAVSDPDYLIGYLLDEPEPEHLGEPVNQSGPYALMLNRYSGDASALVADRESQNFLLPIAPSAPTDVALTGLLDTAVSVSFVPDPAASPAIDSHTVEVRNGATVVASYTGLDTSVSLTGLPADTALTVAVFSTNSVGDSGEAVLAFSTPPTGAPVDAPVGLEVAVSVGGFAVSWSAFVSNAADYVIRLQTPAGDQLAILEVTDFGGSFAAPDPVKTSTRYQVSVTGRNATGEGPAASVLVESSSVPAGNAVALSFVAAPVKDATIFAPDPAQGIRGTVEDVATDPVEGRLVRIYERSSGDKVGEVVSDALGAWEWGGAVQGQEYYVVAINPAAEAQDYAPPAANRLTPVNISGP